MLRQILRGDEDLLSTAVGIALKRKQNASKECFKHVLICPRLQGWRPCLAIKALQLPLQLLGLIVGLCG